ncbi:unnamed protein product [Leuciscus chuanchicus]
MKKMRWKEREKTKTSRREKGNRNVTQTEYKAKATRDRRRWENTTAVKIWRESITKMRREKARDKITFRAQTVKGKGECLGHHQRSPVELVHMWVIGQIVGLWDRGVAWDWSGGSTGHVPTIVGNRTNGLVGQGHGLELVRVNRKFGHYSGQLDK